MNGCLVTDLYRKPTDTLQYLHFDSCHPNSQKLPIAYSQALRIRKICSDKNAAIRHCHTLKTALLHRGYPRKSISRQIKRALDTDRETLIWPVEGPRNKESIKMVLPYHPQLDNIPSLIKSKENLLSDLNIKVQVYWKPPVHIRDKLVTSHLSPIPTSKMRQVGVGTGTKPCKRPRCMTCRMVLDSKTITSSTTALRYRLPDATCSSKDVIYMLSFTNCNMQYIGQTGQPLHKRMNLYRSSFFNKKCDQPVVHHMITHNHTWEDLKVTVVRITDNGKLDEEEMRWMSQLMTDHPFGLNIQNVLYRNVFTMNDLKEH